MVKDVTVEASTDDTETTKQRNIKYIHKALFNKHEKIIFSTEFTV